MRRCKAIEHYIYPLTPRLRWDCTHDQPCQLAMQNLPIWTYGILNNMSDLLKAEFKASIPPIMSGIKTGGDGMRVQFDIPESDIGEGAKLLAMRGKVLKVTVEVTNYEVSYGL